MYKKFVFTKASKINMENVFTSEKKRFDFAEGYELEARLDKAKGNFYWLVTPDGWGGKIFDKNSIEIKEN